MSNDAAVLHPSPNRKAVVMEQLRTIGLAGRGATALACLGLVVLGVGIILTDPLPGGGSSPDPRLLHEISAVPDMAVPVILLGFLVPFAIWAVSSFRGQSYAYSLPVNHRTQQLTRVLTGWVWMMVLVGLYLAWLVATAALSGGEIGMYGRRTFTGFDSQGNQTIEWVMTPTPWWQWIVPFTASTISYLAGSIPFLAGRYPVRWFFGVGIGVFAFGAIADGTLMTLLGDRTQIDFRQALTGERFSALPVPGIDDYFYYQAPYLVGWLTATTFWLGLVIVGVWLASRGTREA
jgi:hypothetical protein